MRKLQHCFERRRCI